MQAAGSLHLVFAECIVHAGWTTSVERTEGVSVILGIGANACGDQLYDSRLQVRAYMAAGDALTLRICEYQATEKTAAHK